jgi:LysM repeat protein
MKKWGWLGIIFILLTQPIFAANVDVRPGAPAVYTVQPGDTLIGIASRYLNDPSDWPLLLQNNPQVRNPYLLYPGEILTLNTESGSSRLVVSKGGTIKLTPQIRSYPIDKPIPIIPLSMIKPFLNGALVVNQAQLKSAPYIVAHADKHITTGAGDTIYVMNLPESKPGTEFALFRQGNAFKDPVTKAVLGYKAINVGFAELEKNGNPATMLITETTREVLTGDRLQPSSRAQINTDFIPTNPSYPVRGQIIDVLEGVTQISQYQIVVIDLGMMNGMKAGNLLDIYQLGATIKDPVNKEKVKLPDEHAGQMMVFRVFDRVSYCIVLIATAPIHTLDIVTNPKNS